MMMIAALAALGGGAVAGIFLATRHFLRKRLPVWVALLHGIGGATGFTLVLLAVVREPEFRPIREVLYLLIATVLLGVVNLLFHIRKVRHRTSLILLHGFTAVSAATMLIRAIVIHTPPAETPPAQPPASAAPAEAPVAAVSSGAAPQAGDDGAKAATGASADATGAQPGAAATEPTGKAAAGELAVDESVRRVLGRPIGFDTNSADLSQQSRDTIAEIADALKARPEIALIEVQGHADERGDDGRNVALTRTRAGAIVNALVSNGVARERLRSAGYGARCPADLACRGKDAPESCHASDNWERDRRVVFLVLMVGKTAYRGEVACARGAELIPPQHRRFHASP